MLLPEHAFPILHPAMLCWKLEIGYGVFMPWKSKFIYYFIDCLYFKKWWKSVNKAYEIEKDMVLYILICHKDTLLKQ